MPQHYNGVVIQIRNKHDGSFTEDRFFWLENTTSEEIHVIFYKVIH